MTLLREKVKVMVAKIMITSNSNFTETRIIIKAILKDYIKDVKSISQKHEHDNQKQEQKNNQRKMSQLKIEPPVIIELTRHSMNRALTREHDI